MAWLASDLLSLTQGADDRWCGVTRDQNKYPFFIGLSLSQTANHDIASTSSTLEGIGREELRRYFMT